MLSSASSPAFAQKQSLSPELQARPRLLALRWLPPREPAIQVAYALTQFVPLNTELSATGSSALQAVVPLTAGLLHMPKVLRGWPLTRLSEHDSLLICAIVLTPVAGVIVTISPKQPSATLSYDFLILSDLHRFAARGASRRGDGTSDSAGLVGAPCTNPFANYMQEALLPFEEGDEVPGFGGALGGAEADALEVVEGGAGVEQRVASPAAVREQEDDVQAGPPTSAT